MSALGVLRTNRLPFLRALDVSDSHKDHHDRFNLVIKSNFPLNIGNNYFGAVLIIISRSIALIVALIAKLIHSSVYVNFVISSSFIDRLAWRKYGQICYLHFATDFHSILQTICIIFDCLR